MEEEELDLKTYTLREVMWCINDAKEMGLRFNFEGMLINEGMTNDIEKAFLINLGIVEAQRNNKKGGRVDDHTRTN